jgi:uncharacterized protein
MKMSMHTLAFILLLVGGINWGLIGLGGLMGSNWNVVGMIFGSWPMLEGIVYVLVGAAAAYELVKHKWYCKECNP